MRSLNASGLFTPDDSQIARDTRVFSAAESQSASEGKTRDLSGIEHDGSTVLRCLGVDAKRQRQWECRCACGALYRRRSMEILSAVRGGPYRLRCQPCTRAHLRALGIARRRAA